MAIMSITHLHISLQCLHEFLLLLRANHDHSTVVDKVVVFESWQFFRLQARKQGQFYNHLKQ